MNAFVYREIEKATTDYLETYLVFDISFMLGIASSQYCINFSSPLLVLLYVTVSSAYKWEM